VKLEFQQDTGKQRKLLKIAGAVLVALWLVSHLPHHAQVSPVMAEKKPAPVVVTLPPAAPVVAVAPVVALPPDPMANVAKVLAGKYEGVGTVSQRPPRGCRLNIEVKRQDKDKDAPAFEAYTILACMPALTSNWRGSNYTVTSAVLSGVGHDGVTPSIEFSAVSNGGVRESLFKCGMEKLTLQAFGSNRATAKWTETGPEICTGGEVILDSRRTY
jgi:hypothetical protein